MRFVKDVLLRIESSLIKEERVTTVTSVIYHRDRRSQHLNKGEVIVAFKRHALNLIPTRQLVGKRANCAETSVSLQSWVHECNIMV